LRTGRFRFGALSLLTKADDGVLHLRSARNAPVSKTLALFVGPQLDLSVRCVRSKGHGGRKARSGKCNNACRDHSHVLRTDVKGLYEKHRLVESARATGGAHRRFARAGAARPGDPAHGEPGGLYWDIPTCMSRGCPLSP
jgi:hypothetical protein